jgi:hypothetical protein
MRKTILKPMKEGDLHAVHRAILSDGTRGRGGEDLSNRRAAEANLFAKSAGFEKFRVVPPKQSSSSAHPETPDAEPLNKAPSESTVGPETTSRSEAGHGQSKNNTKSSYNSHSRSYSCWKSRPEPSRPDWEKTGYHFKSESKNIRGADVAAIATVGGVIGTAVGGTTSCAIGSTTVSVSVVGSSTGMHLSIGLAFANPVVGLCFIGGVAAVGIGIGVACAIEAAKKKQG